MSRLISPQETVALQQDTDFLNAGIPVYGSRVLFWEFLHAWLLIFHSATQGYIVSDISDLGATTIAELSKQLNPVDQYCSYGLFCWYYLPQSLVEVIADDAETAMNAAVVVGRTTSEVMQAGAETIGKTIANAIGPVASALALPLVLGIALGVAYLAKQPG